ncbi:UPF0481 protein At3g47200-like [Abrus precatorius]|uniref:UPF0481 protein At3g47200-like n=1 Tax=Abrus precatorius TaxID=3816 RepID=A0A8B8JZ01_ABRPR|nr:UPF0481 protein At3g47200-like [Abrus precatorius]XP_027336609.1 UPF0481 protein At3g47200-like [Abrus precatorius]XP_027336611.1 UPF0481 protein At3g47200-like [Abrus precatorius]
MAQTNNNNTSTWSLSDSEFEMVKHIIDIPILEDFRLSEYSIYKVPYNIREVNKEAYTPQWISIGPIHLGKTELNPMQEHKKRYFHFFWVRVSNPQAMKTYKHYLESMEPQIRHCYADKFPYIQKQEFVDMILLDAVFIMELLLRNSSWKSDTSKHQQDYKHTRSFRVKHNEDYILTQSWLSISITRDLILIENQIPFSVLQKLYEDVVPQDDKKTEHNSFVDLAIEYFAFYDTQMSSSDETKLILNKNQSIKQYFTGSVRGSKKPKPQSNDKCEPKHFTDLLRYFYLPTNFERMKSRCSRHVLRTATKLQESGVSFEKDVKRRLLDVSFEKKPILSSFLCLGCLPCLNHFKARFRIPQLKVDHTTECVLRNLIAFEQCHYPEQPYICNYVSLIDSLIHTEQDVELLVEKEVIVHELGSDTEVATLVNSLCKHLVAKSTCYCEIIDDLNKHYQNAWNRTMAALWLVYFRDPWRASSTVVGVAVLVFTVFQFLRAVRSLFHNGT